MSGTKILWHSNSPWSPTGYGHQTALFTPLLKEAGYDVSVSAFYGLEGSGMVYNGISVFPGLGGEWGNDTIAQHAAHAFGGDPKGGIVVTLCDVWPLDPKIAEDVNLCCWVPVDHEPAPPGVFEFLAKSGAVPVAMSRFGESMLGLLDPLYVPHGVDTRKYRPLDKRKCRGGQMPDDAFVVGMVAANKGHPSRKAFSQALEAFACLARDHSDVFLYLHTVLDASYGRGEDLSALIQALGIPDERIRKADQYALMHAPYSDEQMAVCYGALDVLLSPSLGEGFGVPVLEAAACGVPSVVTDITAMPEVAGPGAWRVGFHRYWSGLNSWQGIPRVEEIHAALEECYQESVVDRRERSGVCREHALRYDTRRVLAEHWLPTLRVVEQRFAGREPVRIPSRLEQVAA